MTYFIIGSIIGLVMGLTGSGGALVAIPLFMLLAETSLKDATVWSLVAVILASMFNLIPNYRLTQLRLSLVMYLGSLIGSLAATPLKQGLSDIHIALLLASVSLISLVGVWRAPGKTTQDESKPRLGVELTAGLALGVLTTLTGLGGGVLLMPILLGVLHLPQRTALPTSLFTIFLSSSASLAFQVRQGFVMPQLGEMGFLSTGIMVSVGAIAIFTRHVSEDKLKIIRKVIFTLVVLLALIKIF
jgi:uncharacterized protein